MIADGQGFAAGAEETIDTDLVEIAGDDAGPAGLGCGIGMRREDPLASRIVRGPGRDFECLGDESFRLRERDSKRANRG